MSRYKQPYSLYKRGKYYYYRTYDLNGVRTVAKSTGKTSKGSAKEYCDNLFLNGTLNQSAITLQQYAEHFFDEDAPYVKDRAKPLSFNSKRIQRTNLNNHILPSLGNTKICDISYSTLRIFRMNLLEKLSSNTVITIMGTLQTILNYAYKDRLIAQNPFDFLEPLHKDLNKIDAFTLDEIKQISDEIKLIDEMYSRMIILMALTGTRIGECIGLELEDVKQADGYYYIDLNRQWNHNQYKSLKWDSKRCFPIIPEIINLIGFKKTMYSPFYKTFIPIKRKYERVDRLRLSFHSLRHYFITNTISTGIPESKVNYFTGHKQKGVNQVYINFRTDDLLEFLEWQKKIYDYLMS